MHLLAPLASSILYVFATLFLKQSANRGVGPWRTAFVCNWVTALMFQGLLGLGGTFPEWTEFWKPLVVAALFVAGQTLTFMALEKGEVSIATPVISAKVVFVALFSVGLGVQEVRWPLWLAASLSCAGVAVLNSGPRGRGPGSAVGRTVLYSLLAATAYALFDVLVMRWSGPWGGSGRFLPVMLGFAGLLSCGFIPVFRAPLRAISAPAWRSLMGGAAAIATQGFILINTLAHFGDATAVNVVYSSRGLWAVVLVWLIGQRFENRERDAGSGVFRRRILGASLIAAAIGLVFV